MKRKFLNFTTWILFMSCILSCIGFLFCKIIGYGLNDKLPKGAIIFWAIFCSLFTVGHIIFYHKKIETHTVRIKYFGDGIKLVQKGDLIVLCAAEYVEMKAFDYRLIPLGVAMELPAGYKANIYPRSSTYRNFSIILANSVGQIDNSFCGDNDQWMFPAIALRDTVIHKGDRICQFEIVEKMDNVKFKTVESLDNADRGGIGSTGIR